MVLTMKLRTATASSSPTFMARMPNISSERPVQFRSAWQRPLPRTQRPHPFATPSTPHYTNSKTYSVRAPSITSPNVENGITLLNSSANLRPGSEGLSNVSRRTEGTRHFSGRSIGDRTHSAFEIANRRSRLLHQEEGRKASLCPGLSRAQLDHPKELLSPPPHRQPHPPTQRRKVLHQA